MPTDTTHRYIESDLIAIFIGQALADVPLPPDPLWAFVSRESRSAPWDVKVSRLVDSLAIQAAATARAHDVIYGGAG